MQLTETAANELLTADEVARQLRVHPSWVYRHIASGELPALRLGDERSPLRIDAADLDAYLVSSRIGIEQR
ncbi:MAG: helix-turn-helix domain-containing protein [Solirubrobacterales bacterium]